MVAGVISTSAHGIVFSRIRFAATALDRRDALCVAGNQLVEDIFGIATEVLVGRTGRIANRAAAVAAPFVADRERGRDAGALLAGGEVNAAPEDCARAHAQRGLSGD